MLLEPFQPSPQFSPGFPQPCIARDIDVRRLTCRGQNNAANCKTDKRLSYRLQELAKCAEFDSLDSASRGYKLDDGILSNRVNGMKSYFKFGVVICVIAFSISAFAGSVETFNYSASVSGVNNTTVHGTFNYNTSTDTFTQASLTFAGNSIFNGISGTDTKPQKGTRLC